LARDYENTGFLCDRCGAQIPPLTNGSYRNHCCVCLWSKHVDDTLPGDRTSRCLGLMRPVGLTRRKKGWQVVHRCERCGVERPNRIAEGTVAPDDIDAIIALMRSTS
jgi:hypothetical protein